MKLVSPRLSVERNLNLSAIGLALAWLWTLAIALSAPAAHAAAPEVLGIRFGIYGEFTRVVLDIDQATDQRARAKTGPDQLIIDLPDVRFQVRQTNQNSPLGMASALRYGQVSRGQARLVVDMSRPFEIASTQVLEPNNEVSYYRYVFDLRPVAPALAARAEPRMPAPLPAQRPRQQIAAATPVIEAPPRARAEPSIAARPVIEAPPVPRPQTEPSVEAPPVQSEASFRPRRRPVTGSAPAQAVGPAQHVYTIAIDPGHGGRDPGATSIFGVYEKQITLETARIFKKILENTGRYRVALTRDSDVRVALRERIAIARQQGAELFISLHADSIGKSNFRGASVYTLSEDASDVEAALLADKENKADVIAGTDLSSHDKVVQSILIDLAQRDTNNKSIEFAETLTENLARTTKLVRNTRRFADFAVLKSPDMPSVLLELGYLSNRIEAQNLMDDGYRHRLGEAFLKTVDRYFANPDKAL